MQSFQNLVVFFDTIVAVALDPQMIALLLGSVLLGVVFGALPGLTATLGVALLASLTYRFGHEAALISLLGIYVGAIYGGCYPSILINIPGTAASAATAIDGHPMAQKGEAGRALGLATVSSFIGTMVGIAALMAVAPLIASLALNFTSYEFFLLALFGIVISGAITSKDLAIKGVIAGLLGLFLAMIGRDRLQFYPRFTFDQAWLDAGVDAVPVLLGAFGIPQIIRGLRGDGPVAGAMRAVGRITPGLLEIWRSKTHIARSGLIGVGVGSVPGVGEDIAGWVSYGAAKNASKTPERFGEGEPVGLISSETANNACIGGAMIPLLTLGVPGSPPAAMLLGALMLHNIAPGPMIEFTRPGTLAEIIAILLLCSVAMLIVGLMAARVVILVLRAPPTLFLPIVGVLCVLGSFALGATITNLFLMLGVGFLAYQLTEMEYPIAPFVIGVILGPMADENLRRALSLEDGGLTPFFTRPVSAILIALILLTLLSRIGLRRGLVRLLRGRRGAAPTRAAARRDR